MKNESMKIDMKEDQRSGYKPRTVENASADVTIAIAADFTTAGEKLTKKSVQEQGKLYIPLKFSPDRAIEQARHVVEVISKNEIKNGKVLRTLNVAGNGIYTIAKHFHVTQYHIDKYLFDILNIVLLETKLNSVRSGGQSGIDESGVKAAADLKYPAMVLAPKGWKFRDLLNRDFSDKEAFMDRFLR